MTAGAHVRHPPTADGALDLAAGGDVLQQMAELFAEHGDVYRIRIPDLAADAVVIHHPDDIGRVLATNQRNYVKGTGIERVRLLLGDGSMTTEGPAWKTQRAATQPLMHPRSRDALDASIA